MAFTYTNGTSLGQVRLLIGDTVDSGHIFEDAEINDFLSMRGDNVFAAAASAFGAIIASQARLAKVVKREQYESSSHALSDMIKAQQVMEDRANDATGLQVIEFDITEEHFESYRPWWNNVGSAVVE